MSDYTPGAGARTLRWVPGMADTGTGWRCLLIEGGCTSLGLVEPGEVVVCDGWERPRILDNATGLVPDLTDRATFLLALDQLAERHGWPHEAGVWFRPLPAPDGVWSLYGGGNRRRRSFGLEPGLTPAQALDCALWLTRELTP